MVKRGHLFTQLKKTPGDTAKTKELKVLVPPEFTIQGRDTDNKKEK